MKFILGEKIGMSQIFVGDQDKKKVIPVTLIEAGPCVITQIKKSAEKDGYNAVQIGYKEKRIINKPLAGHLKNLGKFRYLKEFRTDDDDKKYKIGDKINTSVFTVGDRVRVYGTSKAKGFQGVVKRHGFSGGPASHGQKHSHREPGSIGCGFPEHVLKGKRMAGRMGGKRITQVGLEIVEIDSKNNLLAIKGSIPGRQWGLVGIVSEQL